MDNDLVQNKFKVVDSLMALLERKISYSKTKEFRQGFRIRERFRIVKS